MVPAGLLLLLGLLAWIGPAPQFRPMPIDGESPELRAAVDAALASMPAAERARSDAYFDGRCLFGLLQAAWLAAVAWLMLRSGFARAVSDWSGRLVRRRALRISLSWIAFLSAGALLMLPLAAYTGFFRERSFGLMNLGFGAWLFDRGKLVILLAVIGSPVLALLLAVAGRYGRSWWLWASAVTTLVAILLTVVAPVYIAPMFDRYERLSDPTIREAVLKLAAREGLTPDIWQVNSSRRSKRISASVRGMLGTERIVLNDTLLMRTDLAEIETVTAHEIGHHVLRHLYWDILFVLVEVLLFFSLLHQLIDLAVHRWRGRLRLAGASDPAVLPLVVLCASLFSILVTPLANTWIRAAEYQADAFALDLARHPEAAVRLAVRLGEYRKLDPPALQELWFFDHPSARTRIGLALQWQRAHRPELTGQPSEENKRTP